MFYDQNGQCGFVNNTTSLNSHCVDPFEGSSQAGGDLRFAHFQLTENGFGGTKTVASADYIWQDGGFAGSFLNPNDFVGTPDVTIRVLNDASGDIEYSAEWNNFVFEDELGPYYTCPTDCEGITSPGNPNDNFFARVPVPPTPTLLTFQFADRPTGGTGNTTVFDSNIANTWDDIPMELRFPVGRQFRIESDVDMTDVTLTASGASWSGLRYTSGASGTLTGGSIDKLSNGNTYAVTVLDADLTIDGTAIVGGSNTKSGVYAAGSGANVTITGTAEVKNHSSGYGLLALNGAYILVTAGPVISGNASGGVKASGVGSVITISGGDIESNFGKGASATTGGTVDFSRSGGLSGSVDDNKGGLYGETGAFIGTDGKPNNFPDNGDAGAIFFQNNLDFDAFSREFTSVDAENAWWGTDQRSEISTYTEDGTLDIDPILTSAASVTSSPGGSASASSKSGGEAVPLHTLIVAAEQMRKNGDASGASVLLTDRLAAATTETERGLLASAAVRLLGDSRLDARNVSAVEWAFSAARTEGAQQPWALRTQAAAALERGDGSGVRTVAEALLQLGTRHAVFAQCLLIRTAITEQNERMALLHLTALSALDAESAAEAALAVSVAFEGADVTGALQKRSTPPAPLAKGTTGVVPLALSVHPNPSASATEVMLSVPDSEATVDLVVYDALGREVATLDASGAGTTRRVALDASSLAPGVYVARAVLRTDGSAASAAVARFTVAR